MYNTVVRKNNLLLVLSLKDDGENRTMGTRVILYRAHSKDHEYVKIKSLPPIVLSLEGLKVEIF